MSRKILVLDAEPTVRSVVRKILSRAGYEMAEADNLDSALNQLSRSPVNLVITNVYLPGVTGHDAIQALKREAPGTPILMVSGLPDTEVVDKWREEQGWDVFPKPFSPDALVQKVTEVFRTHSVKAVAKS